MGNRIYQIANDSKSLGEQVASEKRTHYCGSLRAENAEQKVVLKGWVETRRDHGNLIFLDIRDREGFVQVVVNPNEASMSSAKNVRNEYVVSLTGEVQLRPEGLQNKGLPTGAVEVHASQFEILSEAQTPPFQASDANVGENLRLKYRYLDLRSPRLHKNFKIRHKTTQLVRQFLDEQSFLEIETPILYKSTPEGARDYLVPSRVHPGSFYALPQSPQTLKQLLMIAGYDRYFQIARCFRDEDLRADRQPEFSQIDIEMSFVETEDIIEVNERLLRKLWKEIRGQEVPEIPHMTYDQAMEEYGCDRPDLRFDMKLIALNNFFKGCGFKVFEDVIDRAAAIKGIVAPGVASYSRGQMDKVTKLAQAAGAKGLVWIKKKDGKFQSTVGKFFDDEKLSQLFDHCGAGDGDAIFIVADESAVTCGTLSTLRLEKSSV
jgi:aspartyl-tRNA synthetase